MSVDEGQMKIESDIAVTDCSSDCSSSSRHSIRAVWHAQRSVHPVQVVTAQLFHTDLHSPARHSEMTLNIDASALLNAVLP